MNKRKRKVLFEYSLYGIILILGAVLILVSYSLVNFYQNLLMNLGSNMVVITIVFVISKLFSDRSKVPEELRGKLSDMASPAPGGIERIYQEGNQRDE